MCHKPWHMWQKKKPSPGGTASRLRQLLATSQGRGAPSSVDSSTTALSAAPTTGCGVSSPSKSASAVTKLCVATWEGGALKVVCGWLESVLS